MKKKGCLLSLGIVVLIVIISFSYVKGIYNSMVEKEQVVISSWSQVENVYQRRMDLIPNLVETVKGYATHEKETFTMVTEARSKAGGVMQMTPEMLNDPQAIAKFQKVQSSLAGSLQRLLMLKENYPELKANQNFLKLQDELSGTENRISVERRRFNTSAQTYNTYIKKFPQVMFANVFGFSQKSYFKAQAGAEEAPKVKF